MISIAALPKASLLYRSVLLSVVYGLSICLIASAYPVQGVHRDLSARDVKGTSNADAARQASERVSSSQMKVEEIAHPSRITSGDNHISKRMDMYETLENLKRIFDLEGRMSRGEFVHLREQERLYQAVLPYAQILKDTQYLTTVEKGLQRIAKENEHLQQLVELEKAKPKSERKMKKKMGGGESSGRTTAAQPTVYGTLRATKGIHGRGFSDSETRGD